MPMYYFHLEDQDTVHDVDGTELADIAGARAHAAAVARELTQNSTGMLDHTWDLWSMSIRDDQGIQLFSFPMSDYDGK
jgi:hypothetical protein